MARGADPRAISVKVRLADGSVYDGTGSLNFVDVEVEAATDTVTLRAQLPNPDRMLIDGQLVTAIVEAAIRSAEHTSELQSLMRITYAVFFLKKKHKRQTRK